MVGMLNARHSNCHHASVRTAVAPTENVNAVVSHFGKRGRGRSIIHANIPKARYTGEHLQNKEAVSTAHLLPTRAVENVRIS